MVNSFQYNGIEQWTTIVAKDEHHNLLGVTYKIHETLKANNANQSAEVIATGEVIAEIYKNSPIGQFGDPITVSCEHLSTFTPY